MLRKSSARVLLAIRHLIGQICDVAQLPKNQWSFCIKRMALIIKNLFTTHARTRLSQGVRSKTSSKEFQNRDSLHRVRDLKLSPQSQIIKLSQGVIELRLSPQSQIIKLSQGVTELRLSPQSQIVELLSMNVTKELQRRDRAYLPEYPTHLYR